MPAVLFDTLKMVETLAAGGFTDQQARAVTQALGDAATVANVATRGDVLDLGIGMKHDFEALKAETKHDFDTFKAETKHDFDAFKAETKHDFNAFKAETKHDFNAFKAEMKHDFDAFKTEMKHDLTSLEQRMTIRMGGMMVVLAGVLSAAFRYLR